MERNTNDNDKTIDLRPDAPAEREPRVLPPNHNGAYPPPGSYPPPRRKYSKARWPIFALLAVILIGPTLLIGVAVASFAVIRSDSYDAYVSPVEEWVEAPAAADVATHIYAQASAENAAYEYDFDTSGVIISESFPIRDVKNLLMNLTVTEVQFMETESAELTVNWYSDAPKETLDARVFLEEGTLNISENGSDAAELGSYSHIEISLPFVMMENMTLNTVSGGVYFDIDVIADSVSLSSVTGEISMQTLNAAESLSINMPGGTFNCGTIHTGDFNYESVHGSLYTESIVCENLSAMTTTAFFSPGTVAADTVSIESVSSDVECVSMVSDDLTITTTSGMIRLHEPSVKNMTLKSVSGGIEVYNPEFSDIKAETVTGDLNLSGDGGFGVNFSGETITGYIENMLPPSEDNERTVSFQSISGNAYLN